MPTGAELIRTIKEQIREVDPKEVHEHLHSANGNGASPVIVDVREQHEFEEAHLPGAIHVPRGVRAPDFSLRDQDGRRVTMREYRGRTVVVTFLYSHCKDTCPVEAQQIKGALDDLGHDVPVVAVSVDPGGDTSASARKCATSPAWLGLL